MSGNEAWNRNVFKRWREVDRDGADITLSGRLFHMSRVRVVRSTRMSRNVYSKVQTQNARTTVIFLSVGQTDRRTDGRTPDLYTNVYRFLQNLWRPCSAEQSENSKIWPWLYIPLAFLVTQSLARIARTEVNSVANTWKSVEFAKLHCSSRTVRSTMWLQKPGPLRNFQTTSTYIGQCQ